MLHKILALIILIFFIPLLLIIIIILKFTGEGEIFYLQDRYGMNGKIFKIIKFATMLKNSPNMKNGDVTLKNDSRVLPFGLFLRKSKINEITQLINILKGDMVFVGPRPLTPKQVNKIPIELRKKIENIKPGLTGISSLFFRNEEELLYGKNAINIHIKLTRVKYYLEEWYVSKKSFFLDNLIMVLTGISVFLPKLRFYNFFKLIYSDFPINKIKILFE